MKQIVFNIKKNMEGIIQLILQHVCMYDRLDSISLSVHISND